MKKLKLNPDDLKVESFATNEVKKDSKGTIYGNGPTQDLPQTECSPCSGQPQTCDANTCDESCLVGTCDASCGGTCYQTCHWVVCMELSIATYCVTSACSPCDPITSIDC